MENKVLIELIVPKIEKKYSVFLPINKKINHIIYLLNKSISELNDSYYLPSDNSFLYNQDNGNLYDTDVTLIDTDIRNGTVLVLF